MELEAREVRVYPDNWGRPPNFLLVDFYNVGKPSGSVFEVVARANEVIYNRQCCGIAESGGSHTRFGINMALGTIVAVKLFCF
jgi:hypothetical protein